MTVISELHGVGTYPRRTQLDVLLLYLVLCGIINVERGHVSVRQSRLGEEPQSTYLLAYVESMIRTLAPSSISRLAHEV